MSSFQRPTPNSARTTRAYSVAPKELLEAVRRTVESLPRWSLETSGENELRAVRQSRMFRFKDDVTVRITERDAGSEAQFESASRVGKSDLGQNPRNLQELLEAINQELPS